MDAVREYDADALATSATTQEPRIDEQTRGADGRTLTADSSRMKRRSTGFSQTHERRTLTRTVALATEPWLSVTCTAKPWSPSSSGSVVIVAERPSAATVNDVALGIAFAPPPRCCAVHPKYGPTEGMCTATTIVAESPAT